VILLLAFVLQIFALLEQYSRSLLMVAFPNFLREIVARVLQGLLVSAYFLSIISFDQLIILTAIIYLICLLILLTYILKSHPVNYRLDFSVTSKKTKEIIAFSSLSFLGVSAMVIVAKVDSLMVTAMLGLTANAIYTQAYYIATVIEIPKRAIAQTASTLIAKAFARNDIYDINKIYQKTALHQFIIGSLILIGLWANIHNIFALMPKGDAFQAGAFVVILVGAGKLIDMLFGLSSEIIGLSQYYWFNLVVVTLLVAIVIICNKTFIPLYGVNGAAYGALIAIIFSNSVKCIFIFIKLKIQPFSGNRLIVLIISFTTIFGQLLSSHV
jgi:O-antigen/teichoic acid export membrane protein